MNLLLGRGVKTLLALTAFSYMTCWATPQNVGREYLQKKSCSKDTSDEYTCNLKGKIINVKLHDWGVAFTVPGTLSKTWVYLKDNFDISKFEEKYSEEVLKKGSQAIDYYIKNRPISKKISSCYLEGVNGCKRSLEILIEEKKIVYRLIVLESKY